jgi:uncharacterized protein (UPF0147 family)
MKAIKILKELSTDYIVPVSVRKKIEEAIVELEKEERERDFRMGGYPLWH